ncbi:MAG: antitoxin [Gammaproteobacteria bacterium]|nr:antitoxin [Gammaproteobacteria bacterium]
MSRLIVEVSSEQHQMIKALAATEGKTIREYVLERILPASNGDDEQAAWEELKAILHDRIESVKTRGASKRSVSGITDETLQKLGKI